MKTIKLNKKLNSHQLKDIILILKLENKTSILRHLTTKNIHAYLQEFVKSKDLTIFVITQKNIIVYAILAKKPKYLIENFEKYKFKFIIDLLKNIKLQALINITLSKLNLDKILISSINRKIISRSLNLNLLGIKSEHQSKGLGKRFLKYILKHSKSDSKYVTCETENTKAKNFYIKKLGFKFIGTKVRFPRFMDVFIKKI